MDFKEEGPTNIQYPYIIVCNSIRYNNLTKKDTKTILKLFKLDPNCMILPNEYHACWSEETVFKFLKGLK
jgi:hypothetical protein